MLFALIHVQESVTLCYQPELYLCIDWFIWETRYKPCSFISSESTYMFNRL